MDDATTLTIILPKDTTLSITLPKYLADALFADAAAARATSSTNLLMRLQPEFVVAITVSARREKD